MCVQVKERLLKILTFWGDRKLYDKDTMQQLEAALLSGDPNAMLQAPAPKQVHLLGITLLVCLSSAALVTSLLFCSKVMLPAAALKHANIQRLPTIGFGLHPAVC